MTPAELDAIEARATYDARIAVHAKDQHYASRVADRLALIAEVRRLQGAIKAWADAQQRVRER